MITDIQVDPFGFCNSHCWYCPKVAYDNPKSGMAHMSRPDVDLMFEQLAACEGSIVDPKATIWTAHYNEIFLYRDLEYLLWKLLTINRLAYLMSNGTTLDDRAIDLVSRYRHAVHGITFNVPSADPELWSKYTGFPASMHAAVLDGIRRLNGVVPLMVVVNGWDRNSLTTELLDRSFVTSNPVREAKNLEALLGGVPTCANNSLVDRSGSLHALGKLSNQQYIKKNHRKDVISSCCQGRFSNWVHFNSRLDVFMCCNDFDFDTVIGNLHDRPLADIWASDERAEMIRRMKSEDGLCWDCISAVWK